MLVTTNDLTQEKLNEAATIPMRQAEDFASLCEKRIEVERKGDPDEYEALAKEFEAIGAINNAQRLRMKASGMRAASVRFWDV